MRCASRGARGAKTANLISVELLPDLTGDNSALHASGASARHRMLPNAAII